MTHTPKKTAKAGLTKGSGTTAKPPVLPPAASDALAQPAQLPDIYSKTIALSLDRSKFGNRRKASVSQIDVDADKHMLALSKRLLDSAELKAITTIDQEAQAFLDRYSVPSFFKPGIYLVPLNAVEVVDAKLQEFAAVRAAAVETFLAKYPAQVQAMQDVLRDLYRATDYPSVEDMRSTFAFSWRYLHLGAPNQLQSVSAKLFAAEKDRVASAVQEAAQEVRSLLRGALQELVTHMLDRLTPGPDGKPKIFKSSMVTNFNDFIDHFDIRNVTDDADLKHLVAKAKQIVSGVDAQTLREDDSTRTYVLDHMQQVKADLDAMVVAKPGRRLLFADDDAKVA